MTIDPSDIDPDTGLPYDNYSSPFIEYFDDNDRCTNPSGHQWPRDIEEHERCLCVHCGADGDG